VKGSPFGDVAKADKEPAIGLSLQV